MFNSVLISDFSDKDFCLDHSIHLLLNKTDPIPSSSVIVPSPVYEQGEISLCVFDSIALMKCKQDNVNNLNPLFLYILSQHSQEGATLRNVLMTLYTYGIASTQTCTYNNAIEINNHSKNNQSDQIKDVLLPSATLKEAQLHSIKGWGRIYAPETVIHALQLNQQYGNHLFGAFPIILPIHSIELEFWKSSPFMQSNKKGDYQPILYHCVTIVDYCESRKAFQLQNSWGKKWGDQGCTYFPLSDWYTYIVECTFATNSDELCSIIMNDKNHTLISKQEDNNKLKENEGELNTSPSFFQKLIQAPQRVLSFFYQPLVPTHQWKRKKTSQDV